MIISIEYKDGVFKVTPPPGPIVGSMMASAFEEAAKIIDDGRRFLLGEVAARLTAFTYGDEEESDGLDELKDKIRGVISDLEDLV